ncbi:MAG TPA: FAD-dependent oxidoreductase [Polyangiaceae bacterium]|nr:FAD-dependent oxidoreductase [Polyangiaceae bacterium]
MMRLRRRNVLKLLSYSAAGFATAQLASRTAFAKTRTIERDVCVIGGGSSGTYSAVAVKDAGRSVVVLERSQRLGGHTETYRDPATGIPTDIGVVVFHNLPVVTDYFARLGTPIIPLPPGAFASNNVNFDFRTGKIQEFSEPTPAENGAALQAYYGYLQQLKGTYFDLDSSFDLPNPVPRDLTMKFRDFVTKYGFGAMVRTAFQFGQGTGDILNMPAVYVLKVFSSQVVSSIFGLSGGFMACPTGNSTLYENATSVLGDDLVFGADVLRVERDRNGVTVHVDTPRGRYIVKAKKLVVTAPPTPENLCGFDLDRSEESLVRRFDSNYYYTGLLKLQGVPAGLSVSNGNARTAYNLPQLPGLYGINPTLVPGIWNVKFGSTVPLSDFDVKATIVSQIRRLSDPTYFPTPPRVLDIVTFKGHTPFELNVTGDEIARGYYGSLNDLQGRNRTYYTGAAFQSHDSSLIWRYTKDTVLPLVLA